MPESNGDLLLTPKEFEIEKSTFKAIYVDITHKCNMNCANCYLPNRNIPDLELKQVVNAIKRLPHKTEIRLIGGEPTLYPHLQELIAQIRILGHKPSLISNGLKLSDRAFLSELYNVGLKDICISANGGNDDSVYKTTDQMVCAELKMQAIENVLDLPKIRLSIGCILHRNLNEHVPLFLYEKLKNRKGMFFINVRNIGNIGRNIQNKVDNYTFEEMIDILSIQLNFDKKKAVLMSPHQVIFQLSTKRQHNSLFLKITDWRNAGRISSLTPNLSRGRLNKNLKLSYFFEDVKFNEFGY